MTTSTGETARDTIIIKRYASRKLYDPQAKVYVTLDDVARYIAEGHDVKIVDKKTEEDLTSQYLIQIIAERENKGDSPLPVAVLTDLVRLYQDKTSALTPTFLTQAVEAFSEQQRKVMETVADPARAVGAMQQWQAQQAKMFGQVLNVATGGLAGAALSGKKSEASARSSHKAKNLAQDDSQTADEKDTQSDGRIDALEAQLAQLQAELKKIK